MHIIDQQSREVFTNNEHLRLLSIFYFVFGGLSLLVAFILIIYAVVLRIIFSSTGVIDSIESSGTYMEMPMNIIVGFLMAILILVTVIGVLQIVAGFKLRNKTNRIFSLVMGVIALPSFPLGTALGVFTIVVLTRPSVIEMYDKQPELKRQRILNPDGL
jgi:hypothetical protein